MLVFVGEESCNVCTVTLHDGNNNDGPVVIELSGFLQTTFASEVASVVGEIHENICPSVLVSIRPNYDWFGTFEAPTWGDYSKALTEFFEYPEEVGPILVITDSWGAPIVDLIGRELEKNLKMLAFRVPRIGQDRKPLVAKYEAMAQGCLVAEKLAKYRAGFPLLPPDPKVAASIFRGAAKSGLDFEFASRFVAFEGFHDEMFHPASALDVVRASGGRVVSTVDDALAALKLT